MVQTIKSLVSMDLPSIVRDGSGVCFSVVLSTAETEESTVEDTVDELSLFLLHEVKLQIAIVRAAVIAANFFIIIIVLSFERKSSA